MAAYLTEGPMFQAGYCMRCGLGDDRAELCSKRATRRCLELELCDEHAAEWLAHNRQPGDSRIDTNLLIDDVTAAFGTDDTGGALTITAPG